MKSYLFTTDDGRGGVILCDIDTMEDVVPYLQQRFKGVVRVEQGHSEWTLKGGFAEFTPVPVTPALFDGELGSEPAASAKSLVEDDKNTGQAPQLTLETEPANQAAGVSASEAELEASPKDPQEDSMTGSLF